MQHSVSRPYGPGSSYSESGLIISLGHGRAQRFQLMGLTVTTDQVHWHDSHTVKLYLTESPEKTELASQFLLSDRLVDHGVPELSVNTSLAYYDRVQSIVSRSGTCELCEGR